jgi:rubrerythrin
MQPLQPVNSTTTFFAGKELEEKTNEVARLREQLQKLRDAAQAVVDRWETPLWKDAEPTASVIYRLRDALATAPEETLDGVTMDEWYGGFSKIKSTEPVVKDSLTTEPVPLEPEKQLPAGYNGTRRWDEEPVIQENRITEPDNEIARLRELETEVKKLDRIRQENTRSLIIAENEEQRLRELLHSSIAINKKWVPRDYTDYRKVEDIEQEGRLAPAPEDSQDGEIHAWRCPHCLTMWEGNYIPKGFQCPQCNRAK